MKLLPSDGAAGEEFGISIEISGSTAMIGALSGSDSDGIPIGSVYFFDLITGAEINELLPADGAALDGFGYHTDWDGTTAVIAAATNDEVGNQAGAVYLFDTSTWKQLAKITAPDAMPRDIFGSDVAINGAAVLVGAIGDDEPGADDVGSAYLIDLETGLVLHRFAPAEVETSRQFGGSVAMNESFIVIADKRIQHAGFRYGSVFVFDRASRELVYEITAELGVGFSQFGSLVEIAGDSLLVSSPFDDENGEDAGAVFVFDLESGSLIRKLVVADSTNELFGTSIDSDGRYLVASALANSVGVECDCRVYVFDLLTGEQLLLIRYPQSDPNEIFGFPVRIQDSTLLVGSIRDDDNGVDAGAVYVFDLSPCFADLNRDGVADVADLGALIDGFGGDDSAVDINGDGAVDTADLGLLIRSFGERCE